MDSDQQRQLERIKVISLSQGVKIEPRAYARLTQGGSEKLTVHEYATTGGLTMILPGDVFVNAPFDEWFSENSPLEVMWDPEKSHFAIRFEGSSWPARVLPLPGYLETRDSEGRPVTEVAMSHADRLRLSLIQGCSMRCRFCDLPNLAYRTHSIEQLLAAMDVAKQDKALPVRHILLSGGTGVPKDFAWFDEACRVVIENSEVPVDIMMTPRRDVDAIDRLVGWGIHGFSLNLEVYDRDVARVITPQKHALGLSTFLENISRAVSLTGGGGRVRSLLVVGLEPLSSTLGGVEYLARLGCDPVLSPFRPARGIPLETHPPPDAAYLEELLIRAREICTSYGVSLGPRCIPCQHNTLTFPWGSDGYYFS